MCVFVYSSLFFSCRCFPAKSPLHLCQVNRKSYRCMRVGDTPSETWSSRKKVFFFLLLASRSVSLRRTHTGDTFSSDGHLWTSRPERRLFFSVFASSLKPSPRYIYFLAGWIWNTGVCVCVVCEACRFTSTHILCALAETTLSNRGDVQLVSGSFWL